MTENNTNININKDIYKIFYSTLLIEIKKWLKNFNGGNLRENIKKIINTDIPN